MCVIDDIQVDVSMNVCATTNTVPWITAINSVFLLFVFLLNTVTCVAGWWPCSARRRRNIKTWHSQLWSLASVLWLSPNREAQTWTSPLPETLWLSCSKPCSSLNRHLTNGAKGRESDVALKKKRIQQQQQQQRVCVFTNSCVEVRQGIGQLPSGQQLLAHLHAIVHVSVLATHHPYGSYGKRHISTLWFLNCARWIIGSFLLHRGLDVGQRRDAGHSKATESQLWHEVGFQV